MPTRRNAPEYVKRRDAIKRRARKLDLPCHLCGHPFDWDLAYTHPMSFTADHVDAVAAGGSMTGELRPAHRSCNSRRQAKPLAATPKPRKPKQSRTW